MSQIILQARRNNEYKFYANHEKNTFIEYFLIAVIFLRK